MCVCVRAASFKQIIFLMMTKCIWGGVYFAFAELAEESRVMLTSFPMIHAVFGKVLDATWRCGLVIFICLVVVSKFQNV